MTMTDAPAPPGPASVRATPAPAAKPTSNRDRRRIAVVAKTLVYAALVGYAILSVYPFLWMISAAFKTREEVNAGTGLIPEAPTLATLVDTWNRLDFFRFAGNSLIVTLGVTIGVLLVYSLASFAFAVLSFPGRTALYRFFVLLLFVPQVTVLLPVVLLQNQLGILGTQFGLALPMINGTAPLAVLILTAAFAAVPRELAEAATVDGASSWRVFRSVYLPNVRPALITVAVLTAIPTWNEYLLTAVSISDPELYTLPLGLRQLTTSAVVEYNTLMAGALIVVLPVVVLFLALQRYFVNGLVGAVKG